MTGGAPAGRSLFQHFQEKGRDIGFMEAYGKTEVSLAASILRPWVFSTDKAGSVGELLGSTVSKIADVSTGKTLPPHCHGEVCFRGPQVIRKKRVWKPTLNPWSFQRHNETFFKHSV